MAGFDRDFLRGLNAELNDLSTPGSERDKDRPAPKPQKMLRGKPGSPERLAQAAELAGDPSLISELGWAQVGQHLQNTLHQIRADENRDDFWEHDRPPYRAETVESFASAARLLGSVGDPTLYAAFSHELGEDSPLHEYLAPAVAQAETMGRIESYELAKAAEERRMGEREQLLAREYSDIAKRTGASGVAAADQLTQALGEDGTLYHPLADEDQLRGQMRATAEQARANERGLRVGQFLGEFDAEVARRYGPGSSHNDAERAEWERQMRQDTVEVVEKAFGDPTHAADRAVNSMIEDDIRHTTGQSPFRAPPRRRTGGVQLAHAPALAAPEGASRRDGQGVRANA